MVAKNNANEISITRVYDAPVEAVWEAWTDPEKAALWWGPRGFTLTTHSKDLRVGGIWHYTMHGPDGVDYPNKTLYHEVQTYRKLVYDHGGNDERKPLFRVTVLFSETDGKTRMEMTMAVATADEAVAIRKRIREAGGNATWDRLAEFLDETRNDQPSFVINRSFEAPVDAVFDAWTDRDQLAKWLPPAGFEMDILRADVREKGEIFFRMSNREEVTFCGKFEYREVNRPDRLVYLQRFCDEAENPARHPGLPVFPEAMLITVLFAPEGDLATRVTVTTIPFGPLSVEERDAFLKTRASMTGGWTGSFDKLEELVAALVPEA